MIISHQHQFVFIKTRKTAGTSLEISLADICGPKDVITRISMKDEKIRRELVSKGAQNYKLPMASYTWADWKKLLGAGRFKRFENHDTAEKIAGYLPKDQWSAYYKFCFERNPWDKMVSHYFWKKEYYGFSDFDEYLRRGQQGEITGFMETLHSKNQYMIDGEVVVDKIFKYEQLDEALTEITQQLSLEKPLKMPEYKAKGQHRSEKQSYQELLKPHQAEWIAENFAWEINHLGYTFES